MDTAQTAMHRAQVAGAYQRIAAVAASLPLAGLQIDMLSAGGTPDEPDLLVQVDVLLALAEREDLQIDRQPWAPESVPDGRVRASVRYLGVVCWCLVDPALLP